MGKLSFLPLSIFAFIPSAAEADPIDALLRNMLGTLSVVSTPVVSNGTLGGCTLVFDALYQDWTYRQGGYIKVTGNFGFMNTGGAFGSILKVVVTEIDRSTFDMSPTQTPPTRAYLIGDDFDTNLSSLVSASSSDTPGALFSIFHPEPTLGMIMTALEKNRVTIAFNSGSGGTDILLPIELDIVEVSLEGVRSRSERPIVEFATCVQALAAD